MARIAMFLARSPGAPMTGRKVVINAALTALREGGNEVDLFILAPKPQAPPDCGRSKAVWLGAVPKGSMLCNATWAMLGGGGSLNEALFRSRRSLAVARRMARSYDFAVADTIRAAAYADALGVPWHLDLDDLLSRRYRNYLEQPGLLSVDMLLGYYRDSVPRAASAVPALLVRRLLEREADCLRRRELFWAHAATTVSLVSPDEAASFASTAARRVHSLPMSVQIPSRRWRPRAASGARGAFLGGLDYKPNLDALLFYQEEIFPLLKSIPEGAATLDHIGNAPAELRSRFRPEAVSFQGYVPDVAPRLGQAAYFVAPIVSGTGIKTKVLEAMAVGLPVLSTVQGVSGLRVEHKKHCYICERPAAFVEGIRYLRDPVAARQIGLNARRYVDDNFSGRVLRQRWSSVISELAAKGRTCSMR